MVYEKPDPLRIATMRKRLEGKLYAVGEIKSENYIGTLQAYEAVRGVSRVCEHPDIIANTISASLEEQFGNLTYRATPERVIGSIEIFFRSSNNCLGEHLATKGQLDLESSHFYSYFQLPFEKLIDFMVFEDVYNLSPSSLISFLTPYFSEANKKGVVLNNEFKESFLDQFEEKVPPFLQSINPSQRKSYNEFIDNILDTLNSCDWEELLSEDYFARHRLNSINVAMSVVDYRLIIRKLFNDKVDHRFEYRRQILSQWLIRSQIKDYQHAISQADYFVRKRIDYLKKIQSGQYADVVFENQKKMIKESIFIRQLVGSEKNFVEKFLRN